MIPARPELDSTTDYVIVGQLSVLNMFNILNLLESADGSWPMGVGRLLELADGKLAQWIQALII